MSIGHARLIELVHRLTSPDPTIRDEASDSISYYYIEPYHATPERIDESFDEIEATVVADLLVSLRIAESDTRCRISQLDALSEMADWDMVPVRTLMRLTEIDRSSLDKAEVEFYDNLVSKLGY